MSAPLTAAQAIGLLRKHPADYNTREKLGALVEQVDADSPGRVTVLYSGKLGGGLSTEDVAMQLKASAQDVRIINNSQAAELLTSREFQNAASELDGVLPSEFKDTDYRSPTKDWLYHPTDGPWAGASARFADGARGDVRVVVPNAAPDRVFSATELPRILANEQITTLDDFPRAMLHLHAHARQQRRRREIFRHAEKMRKPDAGKVSVAEGRVASDPYTRLNFMEDPMPFVNEYISPEDAAKYHLAEIDANFHGGNISRQWTIDRERDIYLRNLSRGREEETRHESLWTFYWKGTPLTVRLDLLEVAGNPGGRPGCIGEWSSSTAVMVYHRC